MKPAVKQSLLGGAMLLAVWLARLCERQMVNTQFMLRLSKINGGGGELLLPVFLSLVSGTTVGLFAWLGQEKKTAQARWPALAFALAQPVASMGVLLKPQLWGCGALAEYLAVQPHGNAAVCLFGRRFPYKSASSPEYL